MIKISQIIHQSQHCHKVAHAMVIGFAYLASNLESLDGFTWIIQSVNAGLLQAYCDCSPHFSKVSPYAHFLPSLR